MRTGSSSIKPNTSLFLILLSILVVPPGWAQDSGPPVGTRADEIADRADSLRDARQWDAAVAAYQRALHRYRKMQDSAASADMANEAGIIYARRHNYEKSLSFLRRALRRYREIGDTASIAETRNNIAIVLRRKGRYEKALAEYRDVVRLQENIGNEADRAVVLNNLALVHEDLGHYDQALNRIREALDILRNLERASGIATSLDNIGDILQRQGKYDAALVRFEEALDIFRRLGDSTRVARTLNGIATVEWRREEHHAALSRYRSAIEIYREVDDRASVAANLNNVGAIFHDIGRNEDAIRELRQALSINRDLGDQASVAINLNELGTVHRHRGKLERAMGCYREAAQINRRLGRAHGIATSLEGMGRTYLAAEDYAAADSVLKQSIATTESLLATASGADRRDFVAKEIDRFHALVTTRVRAGRPRAALRALERGRTRLLAERIAGDSLAPSRASVPPVDSLQAAVSPDQAAVLYASTDGDQPLVVFVVTSDSVRVREVADSTIYRPMQHRYEPALERLRLRTELDLGTHGPRALLRQAKGMSLGTGMEGTLPNLVRLYRHDLAVREREQILSTERRRQLGQFLYSLLIDPIQAEIGSRDELLVVPAGPLSYLPFETLRDWDGDRVIDQWTVRYVQSLRVLKGLDDRAGLGAGPGSGLLALGGSTYEQTSPAVDSTGPGRSTRTEYGRVAKSTAGGIRSANVRTRAYRRIEDDDGAVAGYRQLGFGPDRWKNLPGTLEEVRAIGSIAKPSTVLTGAKAAERTIRQMSRTGELGAFRVLHFATHGFVVPRRPEFSALVLSDVGTDRTAPAAGDDSLSGPPMDTSGDAADGYLNMREIADLQLRAEFVALSACRTGLGRIYRGSGSVSLARAFLQAGAESVAVSLWSVVDASTSRFMEAVYRRAWDREVSWAEAVAETKRAFASGHYGERLQDPRFWAPFVHYGLEGAGPDSS